MKDTKEFLQENKTNFKLSDVWESNAVCDFLKTVRIYLTEITESRFKIKILL